MSMKPEKYNMTNLLNSLIRLLISFFILIILLLIYFIAVDVAPNKTHDLFTKEELEAINKTRIAEYDDSADKVENGIHVNTGMAYDHTFKLVRSACTSCHSSKLITQNRATREGWKQMIVWMQATQGLQDLGESEVRILDYLSTHYAPKELGRRPNLNLQDIEWYVLNLEE